MRVKWRPRMVARHFIKTVFDPFSIFLALSVLTLCGFLWLCYSLSSIVNQAP